ncbi:PREDICTED: transcriptional adapter 2-alpha-like [Acropora digitifera]|uniref:transcriptional adapter 2-alpha-like n=1 Tax=Acropora digitifera TaxID=70779 RepID=UPI00077A7B2B|nr:PREDICTED: transcriptional adapter 2-alpha-like [Acropora digitifera]
MAVIEEGDQLITQDVNECLICHGVLKEPYIRCCSCLTKVVLCVECFSRGTEDREHRNDHSYEIVSNNFPVLEKSWNAQEEIDLLDGISDYGFQNWKEVAKHVQSKTDQECEEHYLKLYIDDPCKDLQIPELRPVASCVPFPSSAGVPFKGKNSLSGSPQQRGSIEITESLFFLLGAQIYERLNRDRLEDKMRKKLLDDILFHIQDEKACQVWLHRQALIDSGQSLAPLPLPSLGRKPAARLDISGTPGVEQLRPMERELCSNLRLLPHDFQNYKSILIKEYEKQGSLRLAQARTLIRIDVNKTRKMYNFFLEQGWIKQPDG